MGFLSKLFGKGQKPSQGVREDERLEDLFVEMCDTFYVRPGVKFMDHLRDGGYAQIIEWLKPDSHCALPKGFIRLAVSGARSGMPLWNEKGISMYYEGNWTKTGGLPEPESMEALPLLATAIGKPITLYYTATQGGDTMTKVFEPGTRPQSL